MVGAPLSLRERYLLEERVDWGITPNRSNTRAASTPPDITTLMASSTLISVTVTSDAGAMTKNPEDGIGVVGM